MSQSTIDLSTLTPEQVAGLQAIGLLPAAPAPTNGNGSAQKAPAKPAGPTAPAKTGFEGKTLAEMDAAVQANPALKASARAELVNRANRPNAKEGAVKRANAAIARLDAGGPILAPKGEKGASPFAKSPEDEAQERIAKLTDHRAKLLGERAAVQALETTIASNPGVVADSLAGALESARKTVTRRLEWIQAQEDGIKALGFEVPGAPKARTTRRNTRKAAA